MCFIGVAGKYEAQSVLNLSRYLDLVPEIFFRMLWFNPSQKFRQLLLTSALVEWGENLKSESEKTSGFRDR